MLLFRVTSIDATNRAAPTTRSVIAVAATAIVSASTAANVVYPIRVVLLGGITHGGGWWGQPFGTRNLMWWMSCRGPFETLQEVGDRGLFRRKTVARFVGSLRQPCQSQY